MSSRDGTTSSGSEFLVPFSPGSAGRREWSQRSAQTQRGGQPQMQALGAIPCREFHACPYTREHSPSCAGFPHLSQCSPELFLSLELQNFSLTSAPGGTLSHPALHGPGSTSLSSQHPSLLALAGVGYAALLSFFSSGQLNFSLMGSRSLFRATSTEFFRSPGCTTCIRTKRFLSEAKGGNWRPNRVGR